MSQAILRLGESDLRGIVTALRSGRLTVPYTSIGLQRFVSGQSSQDLAQELQEFGKQGFSEAQLAAVLDLILVDRSKRISPDELIDLVTSGPEAGAVTNRDTNVVVRDLFANANTSVLIAGYAVYQGQQIFRALADRMNKLPELDVRMFLNIQRGKGDTSAASMLVSRFVDRFKTQQWPKCDRYPLVYYDARSLEMDSNKRASLHAKCIAVDMQVVFVSSANFTEAAQERNIEVGLLVNSAQLAKKIINHFNTMVSEEILKPAIL